MDRQFNEFKAAELHCPKCGCSQPVRERPSGAQTVELLCRRCATVLGQHTVVDHSLGGKLRRLTSGFFGKR